MYKRNQFSIFSLGRTEQLRINYRCPNYGLLTLIRYCQQPLLIFFNKQWFGKSSPYLKTPMMVFSLIKGELCAIIIYQKNIFSLITKVKPFKFWHSLLSQLTCASPQVYALLLLSLVCQPSNRGLQTDNSLACAACLCSAGYSLQWEVCWLGYLL